MHTARRVLTGIALAVMATAPLTSSAAQEANDSTITTQTGTPRSDQLSGTAGSDNIRGLAGPDIVQGRRGIDFVRGGGGWDVVSGGVRSDIVTGGPGRDVVTGGPGPDYVVELGGDDLVNGGPGLEWIAVGTGDDVLHAGDRGDLVLVLNDRDPDTLRCGPGRDLVVYFRGIDPQDRRGGCERVILAADLDTVDDLPPLPPVLFVEFGTASEDSATVESEEAPTQRGAAPSRERAYRSMVRQLLASAR